MSRGEARYARNPLRVSLKPDPVWAFLEERDISQNELARLVGISSGYLSQLMSGETGGLAWGARAYDCAVILALAARAAGSADGIPFFAAVLEITNGGTECATYAHCAPLIDDGEDVAYVGKSGPLRLDASGGPTVASYTVSRYEGGALLEQSTETLELAR